MMFVDNNFNTPKSFMYRVSVACIGAIAIHIGVMFCLALKPPAQTIISADMLSLPTRVSIRFLNPIPIKPAPIAEPITPKPIKRITKKAKPIKKKIAETKTVKKSVAPHKIEKPLPEVSQKMAPIMPRAPQQIVNKSPQIKPAQSAPKDIPVVRGSNVTGRRTQPEYPKRALRLKQEGTIWLHVLISAQGKRQEIKMHKASPHALLNQAAIKAVKKWTFKPNIVNGRAVKSWVEIPIEFKIQ